MSREKILAAAKAAPAKVQLEDHREAVYRLRDKGFTWREIADFLTEQGVPTDHTRVYRTFGKEPKVRRTDTREVEISRMHFVGERKTKKNNSWNVFEIEVPSQLGQPITLVGYAWGTNVARPEVGDQNAVAFRDATLVIRTGDGYPTACIKAELQTEDQSWTQSDLYIQPKWEALL